MQHDQRQPFSGKGYDLLPVAIPPVIVILLKTASGTGGRYPKANLRLRIPDQGMCDKNPILYDKISCQYIYNRYGNWLRIIYKILGHKMVRADEEMPLYHARCIICKYEIIAESVGQ